MPVQLRSCSILYRLKGTIAFILDAFVVGGRGSLVLFMFFDGSGSGLPYFIYFFYAFDSCGVYFYIILFEPFIELCLHRWHLILNNNICNSDPSIPIILLFDFPYINQNTFFNSNPSQSTMFFPSNSIELNNIKYNLLMGQFTTTS